MISYGLVYVLKQVMECLSLPQRFSSDLLENSFVYFVVFRSLGEIGRLGSSTSKQMDAEVTSINGGAAPANPKDHHGSNASGFGGFALSAPSLFVGKLSSLQRHGLANGSTAETRLGEESNGSSDPDLTQANKVRVVRSF